MPTHPWKRSVFNELARVSKAISSGRRLELLELLAQGERSVDRLARMTGLSVANASQHLQQLLRAGLVKNRKEGQYVLYRIAGDGVVRLVSALREVAEHNLIEVQHLVRSYLSERDALEPVPAKELLARARRGLVTVIDVRPPEEFAAGHIVGAINVPLAELEKRLHELPRSHEIVAYCRGPYCLLSVEAVAQLRRHGFSARRLEEGYPEWKSAGYPVRVAAPPAG
jgi:rhodanese-related sulfurtransferase/DNA-binding transcriptional ArsR family regulator